MKPCTGDDRADAVAGEREHLGEAVEVDQRARPVGIAEQIVRRAVGRQEIAIGLVQHQCDAALARQREERAQRLRLVDRAGRVVGRDQHDRLGLGPDGARRFGEVGLAARVGAEGQRHQADAEHLQPHLVIEVERRRHDDLLARLGKAHHGEAEGLVAAGGDHHLRRLDRAAVEARHVLGQRRAQLGQAADVGVARASRLGHDARQMIGQRRRRRIAGHRLAHVDQRLVLRESAAGDPRLAPRRSPARRRRRAAC